MGTLLSKGLNPNLDLNSMAYGADTIKFIIIVVSTTILLCFFDLFLVILNNFFSIPVVISLLFVFLFLLFLIYIYAAFVGLSTAASA